MTDPPPTQDIRVSAADAIRIQKQIDKDNEAKTVSISKYDKLKEELAISQKEVATYKKDIAKQEETKRKELLETFSEEVQKEYKKASLDELEKLSKVLGKEKPKSLFVSRQNAGVKTDAGSGWVPIGRDVRGGKAVTKYADGQGNYKYE